MTASTYGFRKLTRIHETDLSRIRDAGPPRGLDEVPGIMYVSDRNADSIWETELAFLVTNSS